MSAADQDQANKMFEIRGKPLLFDVGLLERDPRLCQLVIKMVEKMGGKIIPSDYPAVKWRYVLFDGSDCDHHLLQRLTARPDTICLRWQWVMDCQDAGYFLGPLDGDYKGHRFSLAALEPLASLAVPSASVALQKAQEGSKETSSEPKAIPGDSSVISSTKLKKRRPEDDDQGSLPGSNKRSKVPSPAGDTGRNQSVASTSGSQQDLHDRRPPTPPAKVTQNSWFGYEYTADDLAYLKKCIVWFCEVEELKEDPDWRPLFKLMAKEAPHHDRKGWNSFFERNAKKLIYELPVLQPLYLNPPSEDEETRQTRKIREERLRTLPTLYNRKETVAPLEIRTKLVKVVADAPPGVELDELLQQFAHENPGLSYRAWKKVIKDNQFSFDRAVAKTRAANSS